MLKEFKAFAPRIFLALVLGCAALVGVQGPSFADPTDDPCVTNPFGSACEEAAPTACSPWDYPETTCDELAYCAVMPSDTNCEVYGPIVVTDDGWIHYESGLEELGVEVEQVAIDGVIEADGSCSLSGLTESSDPSAPATVSEEVAFDPATCDAEYLVAEVTPAQAEGLVGPEGENDPVETNETNDAPGATPGFSAMAALPTRTRWVKTAWEDPIWIDISTTAGGLRWNSSQWLARDSKRTSFKGCVAGECLDETYIVNQANYWGSYSNRFEWSAVTNFRNTSFLGWVLAVVGPAGWAACGFPTSSTANFHHDVQVVGYKTGAWKTVWKDNKNGACTNLVRHRQWDGSSWPL